MNDIELWQGNCLELMKNIPDKSVDMILCDPPYGQTAPEWDRIIDFGLLWKSYKKIIKKDKCIAIFSSGLYTIELISSNRDDFRYRWFWEKNQGTNFFHASKMPIRKIEEICIFGGKFYYPQMSKNNVPTNSAKGSYPGRVYFGINKRDYAGGSTERYPVDTLKFKCVDNYSRLHSAQKPVELCEYLIKTYTQEGDLVLDNCMGSGTTGVACKNLNRKFIGIELNKEYFEVAKNRIESA